MLDKDGDGNISDNEIRSLMNSLGYSPSPEDISSVISAIDIDGKFPHQEFIYILYLYELGNGSVDFDEFLTMMQRRKSTGGSGSELHKVFNVNNFN